MALQSTALVPSNKIEGGTAPDLQVFIGIKNVQADFSLC